MDDADEDHPQGREKERKKEITLRRLPPRERKRKKERNNTWRIISKGEKERKKEKEKEKKKKRKRKKLNLTIIHCICPSIISSIYLRMIMMTQ
jgi:hypothetical protein